MKKLIKILLTLALFVPYFVFAQEANRAVNISQEIDRIFNSALGIGGVLAFIMIIVGGIYFTVSGSSDKKSEGKDYITSALWGLVLLFGSFLILNTINPQITALEPPAGKVVEGGGEGFTPSQCINIIREFEEAQGVEEEESEVNKCQYTYVEHGESIQPSCSEGTPSCIDNSITNQKEAICTGEGVDEDNRPEVDCGETATAQCVHRIGTVYDVRCENTTGETETVKNIPDCGRIIDNCSDQFYWDDDVEIEPGGGWGQSIYYPGDTSPTSTAKCITYAYKINAEEDTVYADTHGLELCN